MLRVARCPASSPLSMRSSLDALEMPNAARFAPGRRRWRRALVELYAGIPQPGAGMPMCIRWSRVGEIVIDLLDR